ncbi:RidA family protein [Streptomyces radicis]|uniref:RidA family protein n=1 Tax=Streptomyces radicis TaxID=1750517 RepID=A0A3A9WDA3_9ACTN|nr:RidA family protein [Streptomyces radicis]RKN10965.1 RidA family protein [Streptomyces radicis]RKN25228.1 RidA family protein [Streptomyces radicis]
MSESHTHAPTGPPRGPVSDATGADAPRPQGAYRAAVVDGGLAMSAGMTPRIGGRLTVTGVVGRDVDAAAAHEAAGVAARNACAAIVAELGDAARLRRFLRMTVHVACTEEFHALSAVADGASAALLAAAPGAGLPVRSAIGVRSLPSGAPVEVELTAAVTP